MPRLFVALPLPASVRDALTDLGDDHPRLRWVADEHLHLTLRFIGEVERPQAEDLAAAMLAVHAPPMALTLAGVGQFAGRKGGALWAGIAPREPVTALATKVDRACVRAGLPPERRGFHAHITLARWSGAAPDLTSFLARHAALSSLAWQSTGFTLFESHLSRHGPLYDPRLQVPLTA